MLQKVNKFKNLVYIIFIIFLMFIFKNPVHAKYDKVFFDFSINSINGKAIDLKKYKGKTILLVNVASYCGFTKQYTGLQEIWDNYKKDGLIVLGVPSKSFNQEKTNEADVKKFCEVNFNITFPMTSIYDVRGNNAHEIYKWAKLNYGKSAVPKWNFYKILINKNGKIEDTFNSFTKPNSTKVIKIIESLLY